MVLRIASGLICHGTAQTDSDHRSSGLVDALDGDHTEVRCALTELLRLLVDLRLMPPLRGRRIVKLEHHKPRRPSVALKDDEFARYALCITG